jgi:hypothetical protein
MKAEFDHLFILTKGASRAIAFGASRAIKITANYLLVISMLALFSIGHASPHQNRGFLAFGVI